MNPLIEKEIDRLADGLATVLAVVEKRYRPRIERAFDTKVESCLDEIDGEALEFINDIED